jgi:hypothetical protein
MKVSKINLPSDLRKLMKTVFAGILIDMLDGDLESPQQIVGLLRMIADGIEQANR